MSKVVLSLIILLLSAACVPGQDPSPGVLSYTGPVEIQLDPGQTLPGTGLQFVENTPDGARVAVDGQTSIKRIGDSLVWNGEMVPGVAADLSTRVLLIGDDRLSAAGTIRLDLAEPQPQPGEIDTTAPARYKVPVAYNVDRGDAIPGTNVTYLGMEGGQARLGNVDGDATRQVGESIDWSGRLRDRAWLQLELRTVLFTDDSLNVAGTAEVWLAP